MPKIILGVLLHGLDGLAWPASKKLWEAPEYSCLLTSLVRAPVSN
ncbi:MAG: hypothetical protein ABSG07_05905 [Terriglobales bacterium]